MARRDGCRAGALDLAVLDYAIFVDLSDRLLRLEQSDEVVLETEVAVGSPHNPTPTGSYFVTDIVELADPRVRGAPSPSASPPSRTRSQNSMAATGSSVSTAPIAPPASESRFRSAA